MGKGYARGTNINYNYNFREKVGDLSETNKFKELRASKLKKEDKYIVSQFAPPLIWSLPSTPRK